MKGVVKRRPQERSSAGQNLWCYLFCGLIAAFSPLLLVVLILVLWVLFRFCFGLGFFFVIVC